MLVDDEVATLAADMQESLLREDRCPECRANCRLFRRHHEDCRLGRMLNLITKGRP